MEVSQLKTAVFSDHPVSMKYRGLFELRNRKETDFGKYQLLYYAPAGAFKIEEVVGEWEKRWANKKVSRKR